MRRAIQHGSRREDYSRHSVRMMSPSNTPKSELSPPSTEDVGRKQQSNNNDKGRRRRGRGSRGSRGGRRSSQSDDETETLTTEEIDLQDWLMKASRALGCPEHYVTGWKAAANLQGVTNLDSDRQFLQLLVWLEDRIIRQWPLEARQVLRLAASSTETTQETNTENTNEHQKNCVDDSVWKEVHRYLIDLECPVSYLKDDWRAFAWRRVRVVHWLVACATSELYGDRFGADGDKDLTSEPIATGNYVTIIDETQFEKGGEDMNADAATSAIVTNDEAAETDTKTDEAVSASATLIQDKLGETTAIKTISQNDDLTVDTPIIAKKNDDSYNNNNNDDNANTKGEKHAATLLFDTSSYPLGFSTGDPDVDKVLTILRMNLLLDLEREQLEINAVISRLQQSTTLQAKALKQYKQNRMKN